MVSCVEPLCLRVGASTNIVHGTGAKLDGASIHRHPWHHWRVLEKDRGAVAVCCADLPTWWRRHCWPRLARPPPFSPSFRTTRSLSVVVVVEASNHRRHRAQRDPVLPEFEQLEFGEERRAVFEAAREAASNRAPCAALSHRARRGQCDFTSCDSVCELQNKAVSSPSELKPSFCCCEASFYRQIGWLRALNIKCERS